MGRIGEGAERGRRRQDLACVLTFPPLMRIGEKPHVIALDDRLIARVGPAHVVPVSETALDTHGAIVDAGSRGMGELADHG